VKSEENFEFVKCNLCDSNRSTILFNGKDMVHKKEGTFTIVKCNKCGSVYINPRPKHNIISKYYSYDYWDIDIPINNEMKLKKLVHRVINKIYYKIDIPHIDR